MIKGNLKINLDKKIAACNERIDDAVSESEDLENLTPAQKIEISNLIYHGLQGIFGDFELDIFGEDDG